MGLLVNDDLVWLGPHGYASAKTLTTRLLAQPEKPTAIFAMSDMQALGCIAAIREGGWRVPEDISVMGYDNLESQPAYGPHHRRPASRGCRLRGHEDSAPLDPQESVIGRRRITRTRGDSAPDYPATAMNR